MDEGWNKSRTDVKRENELVCNISVMGYILRHIYIPTEL